MIPKTIHYFWFGRNPKSDIIKKCIDSWKHYCPDWEIIEWNEDNMNLDEIPYMREAYDAKRWAFVSDVARLLILYKYGGVYLDTDVELLKPLEEKLLERTFFIFENGRTIATGLGMGTVKNNETVKALLDNYRSTHFETDNITVNAVMDKPVFVRLFPTLEWNNTDQIVNGVYFMSSGTYGQKMKHYGTRSWADIPEYKVSGDMKIKRILRNPTVFKKLESSAMGRKVLPIYTFLAYDLLDLGPLFYVKLLLKQFGKNSKK